MSEKLFHIYYNTSGNSGLYLNPIYEALKEKYNQKFFVNKYYPLNLCEFEKLFFGLTEKNENNPHKWILKMQFTRKLLRGIELVIGNHKLLGIIKMKHPDIINYSLTNMPDAYHVLRRIKRALPKTKLIVTCHDVIPFQETNNIPYQEIYNIADYLLVHNINSAEILKESYKVNGNKILFHPFPLIDISVLKEKGSERSSLTPTFLFIGVMRKEKGVQTLIDAWNRLGKNFNAKLIVAGYKPADVELDFSPIEIFSNVILKIKTLSDLEYFDLVDMADYVLFPYLKVGNSGVLSTIVSMGKVPITTRLPTFVESDYVLDELTCAPGDSHQLAELLMKIAADFPRSYKTQKIYVENSLNRNIELFTVLTNKAYAKIK